MILISIFFPGLSFLIRGKILTCLLCIILQITIIGWLPAAIWAVYSYSSSKNKKQLKQMEQRIISNQK